MKEKGEIYFGNNIVIFKKRKSKGESNGKYTWVTCFACINKQIFDRKNINREGSVSGGSRKHSS